MTKSPYNFVPLSETIVAYDNPEQVSHDVPFSDGMSGVLEMEIKTETASFIRDSDDKEEFFRAALGPAGKMVNIIPGTSLKGMLRGIVEIASFGRMSRVSDHRYSIRDLKYRPYTSQMTRTIGGNIVEPLVRAGWIEQTLHEGNKVWTLYPCDYARVEVRDLERFHGQGLRLNQKLSSVQKYNLWLKRLQVSFSFHQDDYPHQKGKIRIRYKKVTSLRGGSQTGTVVMTGQPYPRNEVKKNGKHMDFIFYNTRPDGVDVSAMRKDFEFIHSDDDAPNEEWRYWKDKLSNGERMPVFFLSDGDRITSFGLAMMYRLPYNNSIADAIRNSNPAHFPRKNEKPLFDLADMIFGYVAQEHKAGAMKGRVQVGHFLETETSAEKRNLLDPVTKNLGSPRPTFFPHYVKQPRADRNYCVPKRGRQAKYTTFMDNGVEVRGWKRYPIENKQPDMTSVPASKTTTAFRPVESGARFRGKIRFHNLRPFELGALIWSITLGGRKGCYHNIGMAKPLGFGRARLDILKLRLYYGPQEWDTQKCLQAFESYMEEKIPGWKNSVQIEELLTMADLRFGAAYETEYPVLSTSPDNINEFDKLIKSNGYVLPSYRDTAIKDDTVICKTAEEEAREEQKRNQLEELGRENPEVYRIVQMTNSALKGYIRNQNIPPGEKCALLEAYPLLKGGQKKVIDDALDQGEKSVYKNLTMIEKACGRKFR